MRFRSQRAVCRSRNYSMYCCSGVFVRNPRLDRRYPQVKILAKLHFFFFFFFFFFPPSNFTCGYRRNNSRTISLSRASRSSFSTRAASSRCSYFATLRRRCERFCWRCHCRSASSLDGIVSYDAASSRASFSRASFRFCSRDRVSWHSTTIPVGSCRSCTLELHLLIFWPPGPLPPWRNFSVHCASISGVNFGRGGSLFFLISSTAALLIDLLLAPLIIVY